MGLTVHRRPSHSSWGAKPWRRRRASWRGFGHRSARRNGRRAAAGENPARLHDVVNSLKGEPWTWLRDETSSQGTWWSKPSRAGGTPRTERSAETGSPCDRWTPRADAAMRARGNPREAFSSPDGDFGRNGRGEDRKPAEWTLKRTLSSWENEPGGQTSGDGKRDRSPARVETPRERPSW